MNTKIMSWTAAVLWMALIFFLSHQPGSASSELSSGITAFLLHFVESVLAVDTETFHTFVRKNAHFFAYFMLGILLLNAWKKSGVTGWRSLLFAFSFAVLYAASDEFHQLFIPGRSGEVRDVLIDSLGAATGLVVYTTLIRLFSKQQTKSKKTEYRLS